MLKEAGELRLLRADEREVLLDLPRRHTMTCMATSARKQRPTFLENTRCALLGDAFQCAVVAYLLQHHLFELGYLPRLLSVAEMRNTSLPVEVSNLTDPEQMVMLAKAHLSGADSEAVTCGWTAVSSCPAAVGRDALLT
jgi:hypothetical protein